MDDLFSFFSIKLDDSVSNISIKIFLEFSKSKTNFGRLKTYLYKGEADAIIIEVKIETGAIRDEFAGFRNNEINKYISNMPNIINKITQNGIVILLLFI